MALTVDEDLRVNMSVRKRVKVCMKGRENTHDVSRPDLLDKLGILCAVNVLGKRDSLDRHPKRDLLAVHAFDVVETRLVRDVLWESTLRVSQPTRRVRQS